MIGAAAAVALISGGFVVWYLSQLIEPWRENVRRLGHVPGLRQFFHPHTVVALALPPIPWLNAGYDYSYRLKYDIFKDRKAGSIVSIISALPPARAIVLADPEAIKQVTSSKTVFIKPLWMYQALMLYGRNVGVLDGDEWRRHRKIVTAPAASEAVIRLAWDEAQRVLDACFEDWTERKGERGTRPLTDALEESVVELTLKITLFVICATAFSLRPAWNDDAPDALSPGHKLSLRKALHGVLTLAMYKVAAPQWAYRLPIKNLHAVDLAYNEFGHYLLEMTAARRQQGADAQHGDDGRKDLLGALIHASGEPDADEVDEGATRKGPQRLTDEEVHGNMYIFLLAGHETTAHTLGFAFALLALYPEVQQRILDSLPHPTRRLEYDDYPSLTYVSAVFMETLRLHPSVIVIPKYCVQDSVITLGARGGAKGEDGQRTEIACPAGTEVLLNGPALHFNPHYWGEDCAEFKPERFIDTDTYKWPRDAFLGFSAGPRSCLGQKFGTVEATSILAGIVQKYEVLLKEDVDGTAPKGETFEQKRERVTAADYTITLHPKPCAVVFRRRTTAKE